MKRTHFALWAMALVVVSMMFVVGMAWAIPQEAAVTDEMTFIRGPDGVVMYYAMDPTDTIAAAGDIKTDINAATAVILVNMTNETLTAAFDYEVEINEAANTRGIPVLWVNGQEMNEAAYTNTNQGLVGRQQFDIAQAIAWAEKYSFDYVLTGKNVDEDTTGLKEEMVLYAPQLVVVVVERDVKVTNVKVTVATANVRAPTHSTKCFVVKGAEEAIKGNHLEEALVQVTANARNAPILAGTFFLKGTEPATNKANVRAGPFTPFTSIALNDNVLNGNLALLRAPTPNTDDETTGNTTATAAIRPDDATNITYS